MEKLSRRRALALAAATAAAPFFNRSRYRLFAQTPQEFSDRAVRLVRESIVIDMLNQFLYRRDQQATARTWLTRPGTFTQADFERFRATGLTAASFGQGGDDYDSVYRLLAEWNSFVAGYPDWLQRINTGADFARVKAAGKYGILFGLQNAAHFRRVEDVDTFWGLGQRVSQLTYNFRNAIGNGAFERRDDGLSEFGVRIVERMNRVGMVVDCGHAGDRTMLDAFELSRRPVIISHGNCRALNPGHPRCPTDDAIRAMAKTGGVIGINFISFMVKDHEPTTVDDVIDHFDHVRDLAGIEHAGIGSDFGLESNNYLDPAQLASWLQSADKRYRVHKLEAVGDLGGPRRVYTLVEALVRRKYTDEHIRLILGENFRRVLTGVWSSPLVVN